MPEEQRSSINPLWNPTPFLSLVGDAEVSRARHLLGGKSYVSGVVHIKKWRNHVTLIAAAHVEINDEFQIYCLNGLRENEMAEACQLLLRYDA